MLRKYLSILALFLAFWTVPAFAASTTVASDGRGGTIAMDTSSWNAATNSGSVTITWNNYSVANAYSLNGTMTYSGSVSGTTLVGSFNGNLSIAMPTGTMSYTIALQFQSNGSAVGTMTYAVNMTVNGIPINQTASVPIDMPSSTLLGAIGF